LHIHQQKEKQLKELFSAISFTNQNFSKELPCPFLLTDENPLSLLDKTTIDIYWETVNPDAYGKRRKATHCYHHLQNDVVDGVFRELVL